VGFMLVHCFWLLEFKFKFEFYCLNPFSNFLNLLPSLPYSFFAFSPTPLVAQQQPIFFFSFYPASRPCDPASQPRDPPASPAAPTASHLPRPGSLTRGSRPSSLPRRSSPLRTPPRPPPESGWSTPPRAWRARQGVAPGPYKPTTAPGSPTRAALPGAQPPPEA
jgi:hypothetical protein